MLSRTRIFFSKLMASLTGRRARREFDDEIEAHLSLLADRYVGQGMTPEQARCAARRQFGNCTRVKEARHEMRSFALFETLWQDTLYGVRLLLKTPGFTAVALLTLTLGIGANTAIFSMVRGILLRPLPYKDAGRIVAPCTIFPRYNTDRGSVAFADILDWKAERGIFEAVAAMNFGDADVTDGSQPERVPGLVVDDDYFRVMGRPPLAGRLSTPEDNLPDAPKVVVLTQRFWMRRFAGDPGAIGARMEINGSPYQIAGVARADSTWPEDVDIIRPLGTGGVPDANALRRDNHTMRAIARLKAGVPLAEAQGKLTVMGARVARRETNRAGTNWKLHPLNDYIVGASLRRTLLVLFGAVLCVLLIACLNVANLLLSRGAGRERELAVRAALGAGRGRLAWQFLVESGLLAFGGGAAGILAGYAGLQALLHFAPADAPRLADVRMDWPVLVFAACLSLVSALLAGVAPAIRAARLAPAQAFQDAGRSVAGGMRGGLLRRILVVSELALAIVLLTGAGLLIRSFNRIQSVAPGFDARGLLTMQIAMPRSRYPKQQAPAACERIADAVRRVPGVSSASFVSSLPAGGGGFYLGRVFLREGQPEPPASADARAAWSVVQPGYFKTMGISILQGRDFTDRDGDKSQPVIIVSESMAREMFPNRSPLGQRIRSWRDENRYREIVGVVGDLRYYGLTEKMPNNVYVPHRQDAWGAMVLAARTVGDPEAMTPLVRSAIWSQDKKLTVFAVRPIERVISAQLASPRFSMFLLLLLGATALALAAVGVYGVISYNVSRRTREIGIRMALGAGRARVLAQVARDTGWLAAAGTLFGIAGSLALTRLMGSLLFEVSPTDTRTLLFASGLLVCAAMCAGLIPARRASRVDPAVTLRCG